MNKTPSPAWVCRVFVMMCFPVNGLDMSGVMLMAFRGQLNLSQVPRTGQGACFRVHSLEEHFPTDGDSKCLVPGTQGLGATAPHEKVL